MAPTVQESTVSHKFWFYFTYVITILHIRSTLRGCWRTEADWTFTENLVFPEQSAKQHLCQKSTVIFHTVRTHLHFHCSEGSWAALPQISTPPLAINLPEQYSTFSCMISIKSPTWQGKISRISGKTVAANSLQLHSLFWHMKTLLYLLQAFQQASMSILTAGKQEQKLPTSLLYG